MLGLVDPTGERALYISPGANNLLSFEDLDMEYFKSADLIHMTSFVDESQLALQKKVVEGSEKSIELSFAPGSLYVRRGLKALLPIIERSTVLFLNESEAKILTGRDHESASKFLLDMGCKIVVITLNEKGCFVTNGKETERVDAIKTNVRDTTGAGDAFCAGFLYGLSESMELKYCATLGNYVASRCISEIGARNGLPTKEELESELAEIF